MNGYRKLGMIGDEGEYYEIQPMYEGLYDQYNNCPSEKDPKKFKDVCNDENVVDCNSKYKQHLNGFEVF